MLVEQRLPFGYIARKAGRETLIALAIAIVVDLALRYFRDYVPNMALGIPTFLGTAISLILSFKLSQSYERWWEARKIWGAIVNDSRTLVRQMLSFAHADRATVARVGRRQIAWCYVLGQSLRRQDWREGTAGHLTADDAAEAARHTNKALALVQQHARDITALAEQRVITDFQRVTLDATLTRLVDWMGMAERIRNTVFPTTYRLFLHGFIYLFITVFSIAAGELKGAWQVLLTTIISIPFFLLEKTAVHMQDPFENRPTDTPVTSIARTIEINLLQLLGEEDVPEPLAPEGYYLM